MAKSRVAAVFHGRLFSDMESEGFSGIFQAISGYISLFLLSFYGVTESSSRTLISPLRNGPDTGIGVKFGASFSTKDTEDG